MSDAHFSGAVMAGNLQTDPAREFDCVCLGLTILDLLGRPIDRIPEGGEVQIVEEIRMTPAGTAAGPAVIAARLGLRTRLVGAIGDDELGAVLEQGLRLRGVDTGALQTIAGMRTSATLLTIRSGGDRPAFHAPGASLLLEIDPESDEQLLSTRFLHLGGTGALPKLDGEPTRRLLGRAKQRGVTVTCDLIAPGPPTLPALEAALPHVDYFMPTLDEALEISGAKSAEQAERFFADRGAAACLFKCGAEGSLLVREGRKERIAAFRVEAVDTTGCGDAFCAGFIAGLARGLDEPEACRFASATAALVATGLGSDAGVAGYRETAKALESLPLRA
jgi:sugar/nucleoside kinase (ribokinase family)